MKTGTSKCPVGSTIMAWISKHIRGLPVLPSALTLAAALDGHGVAWLPHVYAAPYLSSGRLVRLFSDDRWAAQCRHHYYLCWADSKNGPCLRAFRQWIMRQLAG